MKDASGRHMEREVSRGTLNLEWGEPEGKPEDKRQRVKKEN